MFFHAWILYYEFSYVKKLQVRLGSTIWICTNVSCKHHVDEACLLCTYKLWYKSIVQKYWEGNLLIHLTSRMILNVDLLTVKLF
jgi:hypothetical protein